MSSRRRTFEIDPTTTVVFPPSKESPPAASVILPMYNAATYVDHAISRLEQLVNVDFEVIVVDDGSQDDTWSRLLGRQMSMPHTLIRLTQNAGVAMARNIALRSARGKYVWMIDGDDAWPAHALEKLVAAAEQSTAGMVVAQAEKLILASGEREAVTVPATSGFYDFDSMLRALLEGGLRGHLWNKLFRREVLPSDPFPIMRSKSDYCMLIRALPRIRTMEVISDEVYEYRYQMGSITNSSIATPMDLLRCYEEAMSVVETSADVGQYRVALEEFRYFSVAQIAYSELWRYGSNAVMGSAVREYLRGVLTYSGVIRLIGHKPVQQIFLAFALKASPMLVGRVYRRRRGHRWTASPAIQPDS